jgi:hypothetical protein
MSTAKQNLHERRLAPVLSPEDENVTRRYLATRKNEPTVETARENKGAFRRQSIFGSSQFCASRPTLCAFLNKPDAR